MTHEAAINRSNLAQTPPKSVSGLTVWRAQHVLFWESTWPALLPIALPLVLIILISLFGGWSIVPVFVHALALGLGVAATGYAIWRFGREIIWPPRSAALARLEDDSAFRHMPLQSLEDTPFGGEAQNDMQAQLWRAHQKSLKKTVRSTRLKSARATADERDPFALRYCLIGLMIVGLVLAGQDRWYRLGSGFIPGRVVSAIATQADVWIEPPAYTGRAPLYLARAGEPLGGLADQIDVPSGSIVIAQINGKRGATLSYTDTDGVRTKAENERDDEAQNSRSLRKTIPIETNGLLTLQLGRDEGQWPILALEDRAPAVGFITDPVGDDKRSLTLNYSIDDDYGVTATRLHIRLDPDQERPLDAPPFEDMSLADERVIELDSVNGAAGERKTSVRLESDPWAGLTVFARLIVEDGSGQTGESEEAKLELPDRTFFNPLAKAVIEQRQNLAVANDQIQLARDAFNALTLLPEEFFEDTSEFLMMRTAFWRVQGSSRETQQETVDHLWPLALELEDKALELARRRLEAAFEALRQALEANASPEVIDQRNADLDQAIQDYLQALAQAGVPQDGGSGGDSQQIGRSTIDEMLEAIDELSDNGANGAARQVLGDLESLLENLRLSRGGGGGDGVPSPGEGASDDNSPSDQAGDLIGRQRELSDRAFERQQSGQDPQGTGNDDLAQEQEDIADALEKLLEQLGEQNANAGADPSGSEGQQAQQAQQALEEALGAMERAGDALGAGRTGTANSAMGRAISKLREGAQALAESEATRRAENQGQSSGGQQQGQGEGLDPSGRPIGGTSGSNVNVPDGADPAITRDLIEKMRKRLGDQGRSEDEIDYLERLLDAF